MSHYASYNSVFVVFVLAFFFTYRYLDVLSKGFVWLDGFSRGEGGGRWGEGRMPRKGRGHTHALLAVVV